MIRKKVYTTVVIVREEGFYWDERVPGKEMWHNFVQEVLYRKSECFTDPKEATRSAEIAYASIKGLGNTTNKEDEMEPPTKESV